MDVALSHELEIFVSTKIESGLYNSAAEVVTEALHLLEQRDQERTAQLLAFHQELDRRLASLDQGVHVTASEARAHFSHKSEQRRHSQA